jgi:predicted DsbA family dithiol-disulfide isomerase
MQDSWQRFTSTFGDHISVQFCLNREQGESAKPLERSSSFLMCLAVKAAALQSPVAADLYLRQLRQAAFVEKRDVSQVGALVDVAREVNKLHRAHFNFHRFGADFDTRGTREALQADLLKIIRNRIDTFPTVTFTTGGKGIKIAGASSYQQLASAVQKLLMPPKSLHSTY